MSYRIVPQANGRFSLQREGSNETHGDFATWAEALEASAQAGIASVYLGNDGEGFASYQLNFAL